MYIDKEAGVYAGHFERLLSEAKGRMAQARTCLWRKPGQRVSGLPAPFLGARNECTVSVALPAVPGGVGELNTNGVVAALRASKAHPWT
jgi:hypothetical protein